jgi:hypothetical protein
MVAELSLQWYFEYESRIREVVVGCAVLLLNHAHLLPPFSGRDVFIWKNCLIKTANCIEENSVCTALYRTQLPLIENSFNGCQGHPPLCLPPGTAQRLPDWIQKVFGRAAIYSANSSRWHKCKSGWSLKTERSIVNDMYTLILLIQYGIYFWHELAYTLSHFLKLNSNICGNPLAFFFLWLLTCNTIWAVLWHTSALIKYKRI